MDTTIESYELDVNRSIKIKDMLIIIFKMILSEFT